MAFFQKQGKRRMEKEYWAFDITSISSYSEALTQVKKGSNKEHDRLPQINLALLLGAQPGLPFYYRNYQEISPRSKRFGNSWRNLM
uniref:hypothetical protein n=1 Tax=Trichococcus shcherbakoviae TaxID=2094020 RepID=UPI002AA6CB26|nr:hypothetical protein [Trichococcus shcherbakoviae]